MLYIHNNTLIACGNNDFGQLGLGHNDVVNNEFQVVDIQNVKKVLSAGEFSILLKNDGTIMTTGENYGGQLGLGDSYDRNTFTTVLNVSDVKDIGTFGGKRFSILLKNDGSVWFAGAVHGGNPNNGGYEQLFIDSGIRDVSKIFTSSGNNFFYIKNNKKLYVCGFNLDGQLGVGHTDDISTSVLINNLENVVDVISYGNFTQVQLEDGSLLSTGNNNQGQLGLNDYYARSTFTDTGLKIEDNVGSSSTLAINLFL